MAEFRKSKSRKHQRGAQLVEFALIAFAFFLLLAAVVDLGRMMYTAQTVQDAARVAAREFALMELPADITLVDALQRDEVKNQVFDERFLVVRSDSGDDLQACIGAMPPVNKALYPAMIVDQAGGHTWVRYPGALLHGTLNTTAATVDPMDQCHTVGSDYAVQIPEIQGCAPADHCSGEDAGTIKWLHVIEAILQNPDDPTSDPFSLTQPINPNDPMGNPYPQSGLAAVRVNFPFQAALLSGFRGATGAGPGQEQQVIEANEPADPSNLSTVQPSEFCPDPSMVCNYIYSGPFGLGRQAAFVKPNGVRPYRKLISAQAIFRREVFE